MRDAPSAGEARAHPLRRHWPWLVGAGAVLLNLSALGLGYRGDDWLQWLAIQSELGDSRSPGSWFEIYGRRHVDAVAENRFEVAVGRLPWWSDLELSAALFRPLSAASHYADHLLWPDSPAFMHAQNLVWYALLAAAIAMLYRRLCGSLAGAVLAAVLYAIDDAHAETAAWLAARNTLIGTLGLALTLLAHDRHRRGGSRLARALAPVLLGLALLSSEGALAAWGYLLAYALWIDPAPVRARVSALLPLGAVSLAWLLAYRALGFGAHGGGVYLDPFVDPAGFLAALPARLGAFAVEQLALPWRWVVFLSEPWRAFARAVTWILPAAVLAAAFLAWRTRPSLRFWLVGSLLSAVPFCVFVPEARLLVVPGIGAFALVAELAVLAFGRVAPFAAGARRVLSLSVVLALLLVHGPLAAWLAVRKADELRGEEFLRWTLASTLPQGRGAVGKTILVLNTPNFMETGWSLAYYHVAPERAEAAYLFGASATAVRVRRTAPDTLVLLPEGGYLREPTSLWVRSPELPFTPGFRARVGPVEVVVDRVTPDGRPAEVRLVLPDMDDPRYVWVHMPLGYELVTLPAPGNEILLRSTIAVARTES